MTKKNTFDSLDYFKILNASYDTPEDELRKKYYDLVKFWHPDHNTSPDAITMFQQISVAYDVLKDAKSNLKYKLLSIIYEKENFPNMDNLAILRNLHGQEDVNVRAFHLIEVTGKGLGYKQIDKIYYCSLYEAGMTVKEITKHNWLYGFLGISAIFANIIAIFKNLKNFQSRRENLFLLLHNALAFADENKNEEALTSALLAKKYALDEESKLIDEFIKQFDNLSPLSVKTWNFKKYFQLQLLYPISFIVAVALIIAGSFLKEQKDDQIQTNVKEVVIFNTGRKAFSDVAVAKIFDIPVNINDKDRLYHTIKETKAMHGADDSFDIYKTVEKGITIRITGYTADRKWFRVMFDNGEMAFIKSDDLEKGIGKEIPLWSKIYREN